MPNDLWLPLPPDTTDEEAKKKFQERFGYEPKKIIRQASGLLVGPVDRGAIYRLGGTGEEEENEEG